MISVWQIFCHKLQAFVIDLLGGGEVGAREFSGGCHHGMSIVESPLWNQHCRFSTIEWAMWNHHFEISTEDHVSPTSLRTNWIAKGSRLHVFAKDSLDKINLLLSVHSEKFSVWISSLRVWNPNWEDPSDVSSWNYPIRQPTDCPPALLDRTTRAHKLNLLNSKGHCPARHTDFN